MLYCFFKMTREWQPIPFPSAKRSPSLQIIATDIAASHKLSDAVLMRYEITTSKRMRNGMKKRIKVAPSKDSLSDILLLNQPNPRICMNKTTSKHLTHPCLCLILSISSKVPTECVVLLELL